MIQDLRAIAWMKKYLRYTDYIAAASLYLKSNCFLKNELSVKDFKPRILGHWGTVPGLNFIYAQLNYLIYKHSCKMLLIVGPGHGAPANLANLIAEDSMKDYYPAYTRDEKGTSKLIRDFSWPHSPFPSHITPSVPGSLLEGGELGYSLSTAFGTVLDNPDLITTVVVGDGEAESGPLSAAWHSNKFLNPVTSGAVLPIVHINGFKISNPTIYGSMSDDELTHLFKGYGYKPILVNEVNPQYRMIRALEEAYQLIRKTQKNARSSKKQILKPLWPVILLRTKKGWTGPKQFEGHAMESSFRSHGVPFGNPQKDAHQFNVVKKWLESYKVNELVDENGSPKKSLLTFIPEKKLRLGMSPYAVGGNFMKEMKLPSMKKYEVALKSPGEKTASSMKISGKVFGDMFRLNTKNFRMFCPDEMESNLLSHVFDATSRGYVWPTIKNAEDQTYSGRVYEMLSEHTLEGWMQGYILTGRYGIFVTYEAFAIIIASMVDQHAKYLKQCSRIKWRKPIPSAIYLLSSLSWRQDHNGYSHQNPSFVSNVLLKHPEFCQIYYPPDANSMLATIEEVSKKKDSIAVIVAEKRETDQWLTLAQARAQAKDGIAIWDFITSPSHAKNPDVVLTSAGDFITHEAIFAIKWCRENVPELKIRYVNVSELTGICLGDKCKHSSKCPVQKHINYYFTEDRPVIFAYHGYVNDIEQILWPYTSHERFTIRGYDEKGSTTTPFDLKIANKLSFIQLAMDLIKAGSKHNTAVKKKSDSLLKKLNTMIAAHQAYIEKNGDDPEYIYKMKF